MPPQQHRYHNTSLPCSLTHQILYLFLVSATFFLTRLIDLSASPCSPPLPSSSDLPFRFSTGGGYGDRLSLKLYVYEEDEIDGLRPLLYGRDGKITADDYVKGQWGTRVKIHRLFLKSRYHTKKKEKAHLFFVPIYVKCVQMMGGLTDKEINQTYVKVLSQMSYFRLSGGRNHIFVFSSGMGAHLFQSWTTYINHSIILTPEGDWTDKRDTNAFNMWKDIIIPGNVDDAMTSQGFVQPLPLRQSKYLANFLGRAQSKVGRLRLIELAKQFPDKLEAPELQAQRNSGGWNILSTYGMQNSAFLLVENHPGLVASTRPFFVECVTVILSDQVELPFQNVIDYRKVSIKWPSTQIGPELLDYLNSIPDEVLEWMISHGRQIRCLWVYNSESEPCPATNGILWELQRKVRHFHHSTETFYRRS